MRRAIDNRVNNESGVSLIVALLFVMVVGTTTAALLPYVKGGIGEGAVARSVRTEQNGADAAVEGAIQNLRYDTTLGSSTVPCPTYTAPAFPSPVGAALNYTVTCRALDSASGGGPDDQPQYAILTLDSTANAFGIDIDGNDRIVVDGPVYSHNRIQDKGTGNAGVDVVGHVYGSGTVAPCITANITSSTGSTTCPVGASDPTGADPNYPTRLTDLLTATPAWMTQNADPYGMCASNTSVVTFTPGYYSQPPTPDPTSCASNPKSVWWFSPGTDPTYPGVYYFDFADSTTGGTNAQATWTIPQGIRVIGGTFADPTWNSSIPSTTSTATVQAATPGKLCTTTQPGSPSTPVPGVQWVVGGPTNIYGTGNGTSGSDVELCGSRTSSTSAQQISMYGLKAGTPRLSANATPLDLVPSTATSTRFSVADDAKANGGATATVNLNGSDTDPDTATITFNGYATAPPITGAFIKSAKLRIWHRESGNTDTPTGTVTLAGGSTVPLTLSTQASLAFDDTDLLAAMPTAQDVVPWKALSNIAVSYSASVAKKKSGSAEIDGAQLQISYLAPALEATRCVQGGTPCAVFQNDKSSTFFAQGTGYAPLGNFDVTIFNNGGLIFNRGLIANTVKLHLNGSSHKWTESPFQLPGSHTFRDVLFTATLQLAGGGTKDRLRARVQFDDSVTDGAGKRTLSPGARVVIKEWTVLR